MMASHTATKASIRLCTAIGVASLANCLLKAFLSTSSVICFYLFRIMNRRTGFYNAAIVVLRKF